MSNTAIKLIASVESVSAQKCRRIVELRRIVADKKAELKAYDSELKDLEKGVINSFNNNAIFPDSYILDVEEKLRRTPAWKNVVVENLGKEFADEVIENTSATVTEILKIEKR